MAIEQLLLTGTGAGLKSAATTMTSGATPIDGTSFAESLSKMISGVEKTTADANTAVAGMVDKSTEVHDAMIALQRAEMSLELTVQVRNKLVAAYSEIMRMPI